MACHLPIGGCAMRGAEQKGAWTEGGQFFRESEGVSEGLLLADREMSGLRSSVRGFFFGKREWLPEGHAERSACFSHLVRSEIAAQLERLPQRPRPNCEADGARDARHELVGDHAGGTRGCGRQSGTTRTREVTTSSFFGLCVNDCGWRQSCLK